MEKEEILNKIKEIGTCENEAERRELLASLNDDVSNVFDERNIFEEEKMKLEEENEELQKANMKLFLRIGEEKEPEDDPERPKEKRKFESLFDEKGGIK